MPRRGLCALILSSGLVTLDGTGATVALPAIGRDLDARFSDLQWVTTAALLMVASFVMAGGALGDLYGRRRVMRSGLVLFGTASLGCALAPSIGVLIAMRVLQGAGAALLVPGAIAILRASYIERGPRLRALGSWAGWSGLAAAIGPLLGGALVDVLSWRAVFATSAALVVPALWLLRWVPEDRGQAAPPSGETIRSGVVVAAGLGGLSLLLMQSDLLAGPTGASAATLTAGVLLARHPALRSVVPRGVVAATGCVAANVATAALYFGLFGLTFLLAFHTQERLGYSALWSGVSVLPIAVVMLFAGRFGALASVSGSRLLVVMGVTIAGTALVWLAAGPEPLAFGSRILPGTAAFGIGLAMAVAPLTDAAVSSLPSGDAGAASGLHHAVVRASGVLAIATVGAVVERSAFASAATGDAFRLGLFVCAAVVLVPGVLAGVAMNRRLDLRAVRAPRRGWPLRMPPGCDVSGVNPGAHL